MSACLSLHECFLAYIDTITMFVSIILIINREVTKEG